MAREALKSVVVKEEIWTGTSAPGMPPATYEILLHLYVDSVEGFSTAFQERAGRLMADMPNFRNVQPVLEAEESM